ncbi:MAG: EipA family protein, partial [Pseudomonadota bacterium]
RVMMLVYDLPAPNALFQRYTGVDGSAYLIGGAGMTVMAADSTYLVPVRTGVGARLGFSLGYLKFTQRPTWNPF